MPSQESYNDALLRVIESVVAPGAAAVDASGAFPRAQVDALGAAGILGLTVPAEYGGGGAGLREAANVVRELGSVCGSTAMVLTMHYAAVANPTTTRGSFACGGNMASTKRNGRLTKVPAIATGAVMMAAGPWKASGAAATGSRWAPVLTTISPLSTG